MINIKYKNKNLQANSVQIYNENGMMTILPNHMPISGIGTIKCYTYNSEKFILDYYGPFLFCNNQLII